jgi:pimeloyl-ACP methyl ester carboxylesterase
MGTSDEPLPPPDLGGERLPVECRDATLACESLGEGEPPVVLIHAIACDRRYLKPQFRHLYTRHKAVAMDLRGHGESDAPVQEYTIQGFAEDVERLCSQLKLRAPILVGHSLGGLVALEAAAAFPRLTRGVVMIDSPLLVERREGIAQLLAGLRGDGYPRELKAYFEGFFLPGTRSALRGWVLAEILKVPRHVVISAWENGVFAFDDASALARCSVPFLYVDAGTPNADLPRAAELCPRLSVATVEGAGHFAPLEAADQVNAAIDRFITLGAVGR